MNCPRKALTVACIPVVLCGCASPGDRQGLEWKVQIDGGCVPGSGSASVPVVAHGAVFVGSRDGSVYAIDAATGAQRWRFETQTKAPVNATPAVDGDAVYIGGWDRTFYALDAMTGRPRWSFDAGLPIMDKALVYGGRVIFATGGRQARSDRGDGLVYGLDASSGRKKWAVDTLPDVESQSKWPSHPPALKDGVAYVVNWNATRFVAGEPDSARVYVHAIDAASGKVRWSTKFNGAWPSPPVAVQGHLLLATSPREARAVELHALDLSTGRQAWNYATSGGKHYSLGVSVRNQVQPPAVVGNDLVLLSTDVSLVAIDVATGKERWRLTEPFQREPLNQIHAGPLVYVLTGETLAPSLGHLHGIDPITGQVVWSTSMVSRNRIEAVLDGVLYLRTAILRQSLIAIDGRNGKELGTVWASSPFGSESYQHCSGPVRHDKQLLMTTAWESFAGGRTLRGYLYSVPAPAGPR
jgi:serine/threonine-protein kinase